MDWVISKKADLTVLQPQVFGDSRQKYQVTMRIDSNTLIQGITLFTFWRQLYFPKSS